MKTLLSFLTVTTLSTSLASNVSGFESSNNTNFNNNSGVPSASKIDNLDFDFSKVVVLNNTVWASSQEKDSYSQSGIYKSTDNSTFTKNSVGGQMSSIVSTKKGILYLTSDDILYTSKNNGETFNRIDAFKGGKDYIAINSKDNIYIASRNFLYESTDGITFNKIYDFGILNNIQKIVIAPNDTIYAIVGNGIDINITKSSDDGHDFVQIPNTEFANDIYTAPDNTVYLAGKNSLFKSIDNGNNFIEIPGFDKISINNLTITQNNSVYFITLTDLWLLNSNNTITKIWTFNDTINTLTAASDGLIWIGAEHGLYKLWFT